MRGLYHKHTLQLFLVAVQRADIVRLSQSREQ